MAGGLHVHSEIGELRRVMLHRPAGELLNLSPDTLGPLLFDDIPFLRVAQEEHDAFAGMLRQEGVEVVYLEDLVAEALDAHPEATADASGSASPSGSATPKTKRTSSTQTDNLDSVCKVSA